jgi:nucleotide-binding universal stress UspA family protein
MKTILVPVDFSSASLNAVDYAMHFAYSIKGKITLLYVCQVPVAFSEVPASGQIYSGLIDEAKIKIQQLRHELIHTWGNKVIINTEVKEGTLITQVKELCSDLNPFAVVMGSSGASAMERILFGSNTISAVRQLSTPLIIVPVGAKFTSIVKLGLACDLRNVTGTVHAEEIKELVTNFQAQLHILHINTDKYNKIGDTEIEGSEWLRDMFLDQKPEFHFINKENIEEAVNEFAEKNNLDMLIVIPKNHGILEGIFHKSQTKEITLHTHVPLLSIHE